jgi:hypothetical protein
VQRHTTLQRPPFKDIIDQEDHVRAIGGASGGYDFIELIETATSKDDTIDRFKIAKHPSTSS